MGNLGGMATTKLSRDPNLAQEGARVCYLDSQRRSNLLRAVLMTDAAGVVHAAASRMPRVAIHVGRPVRLDCRHGNERYRGLAIHGDVEIIPNGVTGRWEMKEPDTALILSLEGRLLRQVAEDSGCDPRSLALRNRFQVRDPRIEHIGWAIKTEIEQGYPSGRLFMDSMATALAIQLLRNHSSAGSTRALPNGGLRGRKLKEVLAYIEDNLSQELTLQAIADAAELSITYLKLLFRKSTGVPVHQYVIRRRVERAALLLAESKLPVSQVALEVGFCHQSHLAAHMKRILGVLPRDARDAHY